MIKDHVSMPQDPITLKQPQRYTKSLWIFSTKAFTQWLESEQYKKQDRQIQVITVSYLKAAYVQP